MNSREKGKRGERQWRDALRANGYLARRGQQFAGSPDSPDVVCDELKWAHMEVKSTERFNVYDAMDQAARDAGPEHVPFVMHKRNFRRWLVVMEEETWFKFLRGELPPEGTSQSREQKAENRNGTDDSTKGGAEQEAAEAAEGTRVPATSPSPHLKTLLAEDGCPGPKTETTNQNE